LSHDSGLLALQEFLYAMAPNDYACARRNASNGNSSNSGDGGYSLYHSYVEWIDDRPYLPNVRIFVSNDDAETTSHNDCDDDATVKDDKEPRSCDTVLYQSVALTVATLVSAWAVRYSINNNNESLRSNLRDDGPQPTARTIHNLARRLQVERYDGGVTNTLYKVTENISNGDDDDNTNGANDEEDLSLLRLWTWYHSEILNNDAAAAAAAAAATTGTCSENGASSSSSVTLLVRVFGAEGLIDRDYEASVLAHLSSTVTTTATRTLATTTASTTTIAPPYFGRYANGRVEGWQSAMRPLGTLELTHCAMPIAQQLAVVHRQTFTLRNAGLSTPPTLWTQLTDWHQRAVATPTLEHILSTRMGSDGIQRLGPELHWLQTMVEEKMNDDKDAIVYCHNDLLAANILCLDQNNNDENDANTAIQLIDFEYGGFNYRAFDIANHFNEHAGGPPDCVVPNYATVPSAWHQRRFLRSYLEHWHSLSDDCMHHQVTDQEISALYDQVQVFLLANHLYWGLWAVHQAASTTNDSASLLPSSSSTADYDYATYAVQRIEQYWRTKPTLLAARGDDDP
jgi:thiamine kinase-like enzyme